MARLERSWAWLSPGKAFRSANVFLDLIQTSNFGGVNLGREFWVFTHLETHGFWFLGGGLGRRFRGLDDKATRGGPLMERPGGWQGYAFVGSDGRKVLSGSVSSELAREDRGSWSASWGTGLTVQSHGAVSFTLSPRYQEQHFTARRLDTGSRLDPSAPSVRRLREHRTVLPRDTCGSGRPSSASSLRSR